jgi:hypothetical protein
VGRVDRECSCLDLGQEELPHGDGKKKSSLLKGEHAGVLAYGVKLPE